MPHSFWLRIEGDVGALLAGDKSRLGDDDSNV
jgi:hypothetical protein